jgi:hypothetical protein
MPRLPVGLDHDDGEEAGCRQLLALRQLRRDLERAPDAGRARRRQAVAVRTPALARELRELIAALDRRLPHVERAGEEAIARDAAALRARAEKRLAEIVNERSANAPPPASTSERGRSTDE